MDILLLFFLPIGGNNPIWSFKVKNYSTRMDVLSMCHFYFFQVPDTKKKVIFVSIFCPLERIIQSGHLKANYSTRMDVLSKCHFYFFPKVGGSGHLTIFLFLYYFFSFLQNANYFIGT